MRPDRPKPPEMPDNPLDDAELTPFQIMKRPRAELDVMPYIEKVWTCAAVGCDRHTKVREYAHPTHFYWHRRWLHRFYTYYLCSRHAKLERAFIKANKHLSVAEIVENNPFPLKDRSAWCAFTGGTPVNLGPPPDDPIDHPQN